MPLGVASAASCMAAPRRCTSISPSSKLHHPRKDHGRVFAQAQAGRGLAGQHHVGRLGPQRLQRRQTGDEDRRLAVDGRIELVGRALEAELRQVVAEHLGGAIIETADAGQRLGQPLAHPHRLAPCPGKRNAILLKTRSRRLFGPCSDHSLGRPCASAGRCCTAGNRKAAWAFWHRAPGGCRCGRCCACVSERPLSHLAGPGETTNPKLPVRRCQSCRGGGSWRSGGINSPAMLEHRRYF